MTNTIFEVSSMRVFNVVVKNKCTVAFFYGALCPSYNEGLQVLKRLADTHPEVTFIRIDIDHNHDIAYLFNIQQSPMFALFERGNIIKIGQGINYCKRIEADIN